MEQSSCNKDEAMRGAVAESIENMAFMIIDTDLDGMEPASGGGSVMALLNVLEPQPGWIRLAMPLGTAVAIARALYSVAGDGISEAVLEDVTCELLNTIAGRMMQRLLPAECMFKLGLPVILRTAGGQAEQGVVQCDFLADGHLLSVAVML